MRTVFTLLLAIVMITAPAGPADADIMPPNHHSQTINVRLDFGPYADYATQQHVVVKGDTLQKIAQALLGTTKRWQEIAKLNPAVEPTTLPIGTRLLLPPAKTPLAPGKPETAAGTRHQWNFYALETLMDDPVLLQHDKAVPSGRYGTTVFAVRHDKLAAFFEQAAAQKGGVRAQIAARGPSDASWFAQANNLRVGYSTAHDRDPVHRIDWHMRVKSLSGAVIQFEELGVKYFDANEKELTAAEVDKAKSQWNFLLLFLALLGIAGLVYVVRRRGAHTRAATA